jgi:hypothetical protein
MEKIIERIKKLMAMAEDASSPHEAAIAAKRARSLMDKHQIDKSDLTEKPEFGTKTTSWSYAFTPKWMQSLAVAVAEYNDCQVGFKTDHSIQREKRYKFMEFKGFEVDAILAEYTYQYVCDTITRLCKSYMVAEGYDRYNARVGDTFKWNAAIQVIRMLNESKKERETMTSSGTDLMVVKSQLVAEHFGEAKYGKSSKKQHDDWEAYRAGKAGAEAGRNIRINDAINDNGVRGAIK